MHIKVDEDIPPIAAAWLREKGYEASTVVEQGIRPILDLLKMVLSEVDMQQLTGAVSVATPRGLRIRRA